MTFKFQILRENAENNNIKKDAIIWQEQDNIWKIAEYKMIWISRIINLLLLLCCLITKYKIWWETEFSYIYSNVNSGTKLIQWKKNSWNVKKKDENPTYQKASKNCLNLDSSPSLSTTIKKSSSAPAGKPDHRHRRLGSGNSRISGGGSSSRHRNCMLVLLLLWISIEGPQPSRIHRRNLIQPPWVFPGFRKAPAFLLPFFTTIWIVINVFFAFLHSK